MKPSEIISLARRQTGCTEDIVTEDEAYRFLNFVIEDFGAEIRLSDAGYGLASETIDLIAGQNEYERQGEEIVGDATVEPKFAIDKILKVGVLQQNGKYHEIPVRFVDEIKINNIISAGEPREAFISSNKLTLVPTPNTNGQIVVYGLQKNFEILGRTLISSGRMYRRYTAKDNKALRYPCAWCRIAQNYTQTPEEEVIRYTSTSNPDTYDSMYGLKTDGTWNEYAITSIEGGDIEGNIWIPARRHHILVEGMKFRMYGNMGVGYEATRMNTKNFYDSEKLKAIQQLTDRGQMAEEGTEPYLDYLA